VPDCGLAPGLSHLLAGRFAARHGTPRRLVIRVGGVAEDASRPYGYVVTWSLPDLVEEYTRPARIVRNGAITAVPALAELERVHIEGAGEMEAFLSDGLRTLLFTMPDVRDMEEKTLRWPGHVEQIRPLLASGRLVEEFRVQCVVQPPRDRVVMSVEAEWDGARREATLLDRFDPVTGLTAMARTTALTTATVARLAATGGLQGSGVLPLERVARDESACRFIAGALVERGVTLSLPD
jgi:saccharopine dehydrogenase-like NADP-dependent oxidoreductase